MRLTRRGCFVPKGMLYVWYVYSTAWEAEEFETGTFTPSRYGGNRMAADSYETSQDGFTLINPSSTSSSQLQVGDYLVDVSTNGSTAVSGEYLYRITGKTGSFLSQEFEYTSYKAVQKRGEVVLRIVESETPDYPIDGEYNGEWYVMMKGKYVMYVWSQYNASGEYAEKTSINQQVDWPGGYRTIYQYWSGQSSFTANCKFDKNTGIYTLNYGYKGVSGSDFMDYDDNGGSFTGAWMFDDPSGTTVYEGADIITRNYVKGVTVRKSEFEYNKTDYIGIVQSYDPEAYPQDGVQGGYWYTYSHSYNYVFDNQ